MAVFLDHDLNSPNHALLTTNHRHLCSRCRTLIGTKADISPRLRYSPAEEGQPSEPPIPWTTWLSHLDMNTIVTLNGQSRPIRYLLHDFIAYLKGLAWVIVRPTLLRLVLVFLAMIMVKVATLESVSRPDIFDYLTFQAHICFGMNTVSFLVIDEIIATGAVKKFRTKPLFLAGYWIEQYCLFYIFELHMRLR